MISNNYQENTLAYPASANLQLNVYLRNWLINFLENARDYSSSK